METEHKAARIAKAPRTIAIIEEIARLLNDSHNLFSAARIAVIRIHKGKL